jgi:probable rRNA maturation factor
MQIEIIDNQEDVRTDLQHLKDVCSYISGKFDPDDRKSLNVILIDDGDMRDLNNKYRNIDRTTDVLSFSYLEESIGGKREENPEVIGEVFISPLTAQKNSRKQEDGWSLELEIILLIIHGILHVYGYDHEQEEEKAVMYSIQDSLVNDIRGRDWNRY